MQVAIRSYICDDPSNSETSFSRISEDVRAGRTLQDVVEEVEVYLTSSVDVHRNRATYLLYQLLAAKVAELSAVEIHLFVVFFAHRFGDSASVPSAVLAVTALIHHYGELLDPTYGDLSNVMTSLRTHVRSALFPYSVRQNILELVVAILKHGESYGSIPLTQSDDAILFVVTSIEGEKDPRCLLVGFRALHLALSFSKGRSSVVAAEDIVDAVTVYFPVAHFPPPPSDSIWVTSTILSDAMQQILCYHRAVASSAMPFFVGQIRDGDSLQARVDSFNCVSKAVSLHGYSVLREALLEDNIADLLYDIVVSEGSQDVVNKAMELAGSINFSICKDASELCEEDWRTVQLRILQRTHLELKGNIDSLKARMAWKLSMLLASSGGFVAIQRVVSFLLPFVLERAKDCLSTLAVQKSSLIAPEAVAMLNNLICVAFPDTVETSRLLANSDLIDINSVASLLFSLFSIDLGEKPGQDVESDKVRLVVNTVRSISEVLKRLSGAPLEASVWAERVNEALAFSLYGPQRVLRSESSGQNAYFWASVQGAELVESELLGMWRQLAAMEQMTDILHSKVALPILSRIRLLEEPMPSEIAILAATLSNSHLAGCVVLTLVDELPNAGPSAAFLIDAVNEAFRTATSEQKRLELFAAVLNNERSSAVLFSLLVDRLAKSESTRFHYSILQLIQWLFKSAPSEDHSALFISLFSRLENALQHSYGLEVLHSSLLHVDVSCNFFTSDACGALAMQLLRSEADAVCRSRFVSPSVGILVNKIANVDGVRSIVQAVQDWGNQYAGLDSAVAELFMWVAKGLLLRPDISLQSLQEHTIALLVELTTSGDVDKSSKFAQCVSILFDEKGWATRYRRSVLWKQKLLARLIPGLRSCCSTLRSQLADESMDIVEISALPLEKSEPARKINALLVLCQIISSVDPKLTLGHADTIDLLVQAVGAAGSSIELQRATLSALVVVLGPELGSTQSISNGLNSILPFLEQVMTSANEARMRALAIECLARVPVLISYPALYPFRARIVKTLAVALNDRKRAVRMLASKVRNQWILLR